MCTIRFEPGILVLKQQGPMSGVSPSGVAQTHDMEFFLRYFVELELPVSAVGTALDALPAEWLAGVANKAHARSLRLMLEADPLMSDNLVGAVVVFGVKPAIHQGSTSIRTMAWALVGPQTARPLLEADLEVGSLGRGRSQLAVAGRFYWPGSMTNRHIDRGTAHQIGEATIKGFVDGLARLVGTPVLWESPAPAVA
jgi:hypothetical protein